MKINSGNTLSIKDLERVIRILKKNKPYNYFIGNQQFYLYPRNVPEKVGTIINVYDPDGAGKGKYKVYKIDKLLREMYFKVIK